MRVLSNAEVAERAKALGHTQLALGQTASGYRWWMQCACGWGAFTVNGQPTVTTASQIEAVKRCQHHLARAVRDDLRGRRMRGEVLPDEGVLL